MNVAFEDELFTRIATAIRTEFPGTFVVGEYVNAPSRFPAVYIVEQDNAVHRAGRDTANIENFSDVMYQVDIYSNKNKGKKAECKAIAAFVDAQFAALGFTRTVLTPVPNMDDGTIYRMTGRFQAVVGNDNMIYRR